MKHLQANLNTIFKNSWAIPSIRHNLPKGKMYFGRHSIKNINTTRTVYKVRLYDKEITSEIIGISELPPKFDEVTSGADTFMSYKNLGTSWSTRFFFTRHTFKSEKDARLFLLINSVSYREDNPIIHKKLMDKYPEYFI